MASMDQETRERNPLAGAGSVGNASVKHTMEPASRLPVRIRGIEFELLAERGVYWPDHQVLFVADTHFGKEASFQRAGIPAPRGGMTATLQALHRMLEATGARKVIILGDLFHARCSFAAEVRSEFQAFLDHHRSLQWVLVEGNHDQQAGKLPREWKIELVKPGRALDGLLLHHQPVEFEACHSVAAGPVLELCGHLHPAIDMRHGGERIGRFPCFWLTRNRLVLPALGQFTGHLSIKPQADDQAWLIVESQIISLQGY